MKPVTIELNKAELEAIRRYLTSQRRGDAFSADDHEATMFVLRRIGFHAADAVFPDYQRTRGICVVCGCTKKDACPPGCSWEEGFDQTVCDTCADA